MFSTGAQPYNLISEVTEYPITVAEFKQWAKINNSVEDSLIQRIIAGVTLEAEKYTKRDFILKVYQTFRDRFGDVDESPSPVPVQTTDHPVVLRRSPFDQVVLIVYQSDGQPVNMDLNDVRVVQKDSFSQIVPVNSWPTVDLIPQAIEIQFQAGYGSAADVPSDIKNALLAHATAVYFNRGDCSDGSGVSCSCKFAPPESISVYNQYRIVDFRAF